MEGIDPDLILTDFFNFSEEEIWTIGINYTDDDDPYVDNNSYSFYVKKEKLAEKIFDMIDIE